MGLIGLFVFSAALVAYLDQETYEFNKKMLVNADVAQTKGDPPLPTAGLCGNTPLPTTPQEPIYQDLTLTNGRGESFTVTTWRLPCDAGSSMPILTVRPIDSSPFICRDIIIQDGVQSDDFFITQGVSADLSFCGNLLIAASFTIDTIFNSVTNTQDEFIYVMLGEMLTIPAYDPALYDLTAPPLDKITDFDIKIGDKTFGYRECGVSTFINDLNGKFQSLNADCNIELPFFKAGFE